MRMMVVDDYAPFVAVVAHYLRRHKAIQVVGQTCDVVNGLKLVDELQPDLVLVDYSMPLMDGITFTRLVKSRQRSPKVVVMSFITDFSLKTDAIEAGADGFVEKNRIYTELLPLLRRLAMPEETAEHVAPGGGSDRDPGTSAQSGLLWTLPPPRQGS